MASRRGSVLACVGVVIALACSCRGDPTTVMTRLEGSLRALAELRVHFSGAANASNSAVMADTDEAAIAAAREAEKATKEVEARADALARLLEGLNYASESQILREFKARFSEYKKLDSRILALAVENTNLKASALSVGPARQSADGFRRLLESIASSSPTKDRCRIDGLVSEAVLAVREIQLLYAPHIAERDEATMARMEKEMADLDAKARAALGSLRELVPTAGAALGDALSKLDQLEGTSRQIVELSRRNTDVVSLDLALRQMPTLKAACDERLQALQVALEKEEPKPTR